MNTGLSSPIALKVSFYNDNEDFLFDRSFNFLERFGSTLPAISLYRYRTMTQEELEARKEAFFYYLQALYNINIENIEETNDFIIQNDDNCLLINSKKDSFTETIETTLKRRFNNTTHLETDIDGVSYKEDDYFLEFEIAGEESIEEIDYHKANIGELIYKAGIERKDIVFDINDKGELLVIGPDAENYYINESGELCYKLFQIPIDQEFSFEFSDQFLKTLYF